MNKKRIFYYIYAFVFMMSIVLTSGAIAKYVNQESYINNQVTQEDFFFTTDLMHNEYGDLNDTSTNVLEIPVYGNVVGTERLVFSVINYYDELRINTQEIDYEITVSDDNDSVSYSLYHNEVGNTNVYSGTQQLGIDSTAANPPVIETHKYKLSASGEISEDTTVTVTIKALSPFKKELKIIYHLYPDLTGVYYKIEDAIGNLYAEVKVMNANPNPINQDEESIIINIADVSYGMLLVDETNPNIKFNIETGDIYPRSIIVTKVIAYDGSYSLIFFKTDVSQNYSVEEQELNPNASGDYVINIG